MAELMFISETGMFHSACRCTWDDGVKWYGFQPEVHRKPVAKGKVETTDRTKYINHYIKFTIDDSLLRRAVESVVQDYSQRKYVLGVCDCVSFTSEIARQCRLRVTPVNMTPYGFLQFLGYWNKYDEKG